MDYKNAIKKMEDGFVVYEESLGKNFRWEMTYLPENKTIKNNFLDNNNKIIVTNHTIDMPLVGEFHTIGRIGE